MKQQCIRLAVLEPDYLLPKELAFLKAAKRRIQRSQNVRIEIVSVLEEHDVVYNPYTKESYLP